MKITCNKQALATAFDAVRGCLPSRSPKPVLTNVKLSCGVDVTLEATDLERSMVYRVSGVEVRQPGEVLIPGTKLGDILRETPDDEIDVYDDDKGNLHFKSKSGRFRVGTESADLFPSAPEMDGDAMQIRACDLATGIKRTVYAAATENSRYALNAVLFDTTNGSFVATDGKRVSVMPMGFTSERDGYILVPPQSATIAAKLCGDPDEMIDFRVSDSAVQFSTPKARFWTRLCEGRYPAWKDTLPGKPTQTVRLDAKALESALKRVRVATSEESKGVTFTFSENLLTLKGSCQDGDAETELECECSPLVVTFDPVLIIEFLRSLDGGATVDAKFVDGRKAAAFACDEQVYVAMPLTKEAR